MIPVLVCCTYEPLVARTEYVPAATDTLYWPDAFVDVAVMLVLPLRTVIPMEASGEPSASFTTVPAIHPAVKPRVKFTHFVVDAVTTTPLCLDALCSGSLALTVEVPGGSWIVADPSL